MFKKILNIVTKPDILWLNMSRFGLLKWMKDEKYLRKAYKLCMKKNLNLSTPKTFNEKIQWLKLYNRKNIYTTMVDKHKAKQLVADSIGDDYIIPTLGVWNNFDDIDFDSLPNQFVLKCTHDSGSVVICRDKSTFDIKNAKKKIKRYLRNNGYNFGREWAYKHVEKLIIAEKYMEDDFSIKEGLTDYKFFCFNGEPKFLYVSTGLENHKTAHISFLTLDWQFTKFQRSDYAPLDTLPRKPVNFDKMVEISRKLSKDIPFLRVDLYEINNKIYFSELTFYPCSGFMPFVNPDDDEFVGNMLILPEEKTEND